MYKYYNRIIARFGLIALYTQYKFVHSTSIIKSDGCRKYGGIVIFLESHTKKDTKLILEAVYITARSVQVFGISDDSSANTKLKILHKKIYARSTIVEYLG